jgi:hypothetical protein
LDTVDATMPAWMSAPEEVDPIELARRQGML